MKYILIDQIKNGDMFTEEYNDLEQARAAADRQFSSLSAHDKARRESFFVLKSVNPDEEAMDHFDGDPVYTLK